MKRSSIFVVFAGLFIVLSISGCATDAAADPASAVENYWLALTEKDSARLSSYSCADYEATALTTLESFQSVEVVAKDVECSIANTTTDSVEVTCKGTLVASYGAEDLVIDLSQKSYLAVNEGGEWRMCGEK